MPMATNAVRKHFSYTIKDFYSTYRKNRKKESPDGEIISYKTYRKIIESFFLEISRRIIYENFTFMMPYSLGSLLVKARRTNLKKAKTDFFLSKKYKKPIKLINNHTFGYYFMITWDKSYTRFKNNTYYLYSNTSSDKAESKGIGKKGLSDHITALSKDPTRRSYIKM